MSKYLNLEIENKVAIVTINRPPVNALNPDVTQEISQMFDELKNNKEIEVVILTGTGKAFVAGADINGFLNLDRRTGEAFALGVTDMQRKIEDFELPVIAAINGYTLGGGCELVMACDIRIASSNAKFGQPEITVGVMAGAGGTQRLPRLIGMGRAKKLLYSGEFIDAVEAERIGLVDQVTAPGEELNEAKKLAQKMMKNAPIALRYTKKAVNRGMQMPLEDALKMEAMLFGALLETEDVKEGVNAFIEKRKPLFKGK
ncbi:MAG: enoyl-CoA hydratase/isomerase family protein [Dehalococcoidales bacterium]|nr:enoyl-CoA hydratase/isomerase family protein [Dehalococcoidales bacterium]